MSVLLDNISDVEGQALDYVSRYDVSPEAMSYLQRNPDVAEAYAANSYGLTPDQFAAIHFERHGQQEGRQWTPNQPSPAVIARQEQLAASLPRMSQAGQEAALQQAYGNIGTPVQNTDDRYGGEGQGSPFFQASGLSFLEPTQTGFRGPVSGVFDQPGPGGQYGQYMGTFSPSGQLQDVEWTKQERPTNFDKYAPLIPAVVSTLAGLPTGLETLASAVAAGTPELVIGGGAFAGAAPTASLASLSSAAGFVEGAGELFTTDFTAANNAVNTVANNPVLTAIADATPQALESMASTAGNSLNVPAVTEAVNTFGQTVNQGIDFVRNLGSNIGETLFPNASPEVQRLAGDYAIRYATTGDPEEALKGSALGFATGQISNYVTDVTGSDIAGRAASQAAQQLATRGEIDPRSILASEVGRYVGSQVGEATDSSLARNAASSLTRDVISGRDPTAGLVNVGTGAFLDRVASGVQDLLQQPAPIEARTAESTLASADDLTQELYPPAARSEAATSFASGLPESTNVVASAEAAPPPVPAAETSSPPAETPLLPVAESSTAEPQTSEPLAASPEPVESPAAIEPVAEPAAPVTFPGAESAIEPVAAPVSAPLPVSAAVPTPTPVPVETPAAAPVISAAPTPAPRTPPPIGLGNIIGSTVQSRVNNAARARVAPPPRRPPPRTAPPRLSTTRGGLAMASQAMAQRPPARTVSVGGLRPISSQPQRQPVPMRVDPSRLTPVTNVATLSRILANIRRPG